MARGRPSNALREFVRLYVSGPPHVQGLWNDAAAVAGLEQPPDPSDPTVMKLIEQAGGVEKLTPKADPQPLSALENLLTKADDGLIPWKELRGELTDVIRAVAQGTVQARAAQVTMLRFIIEKAEKESAEQEEVHSVILLPVQGVNAEMTMDQQWMDKIKSMETPAE